MLYSKDMEDDSIGVNQAIPPGEDSRSFQNTTAHPERWVEEYGDYLFRYALLRLRDATKAEDVVQETFLAALKARDRFCGHSAERTWLIGILKNKVGDYYRSLGRETSFTDLEFYAKEESHDFVGEGFSQGAWTRERRPADWPTLPSASLEAAEFWTAFRECLGRLPHNISRVFVMREVDEIESREICDQLKISDSNLWVMLHRARLALRRCLESNWFEKEKG